MLMDLILTHCLQDHTPFGRWSLHLITSPPEMCMTTPFMFLTCVIPGPKNPKNKIDVYLQPLFDELKELWDVGVETYDISTGHTFQMKADVDD